MKPDDALSRLNGMKFGKLIHRYRIDQGIIIKDLSDLCGLTPAAISQIENSRREPQLSTALKLMKALHIPITQLLLVGFDHK
jgi:transcriptional regulator with XRE-family HTH domain